MALIKVTHNLNLLTADAGDCLILILDLSSAFDTVFSVDRISRRSFMLLFYGLDYINALYCIQGKAKKTSHAFSWYKTQLLTRSKIISALASLHWLPVRFRVDFTD